MTRIHSQKTNFTAGAIAPELLGRSDLRVYDNGAAQLANVFLQPTGGLSRRPGLQFLDDAPGPGRLVAFEFNSEQTYVLVFTEGRLDVYQDALRIAGGIETLWSLEQLAQLAWVQSADTLLLVHPEVPPRRLLRRGPGDWSLEPWVFVERDGFSMQPFHRFDARDAAIHVRSYGDMLVAFASQPIFTPEQVGTRIRINGGEIEILEYGTPDEVLVAERGAMTANGETKDWQEQAFQPRRGWPVSVTFHQDRLVIGGSRDAPNHLWISKTGEIFDFDPGEGLDDEAIDFSILSDQVNAIRAVFSGRHLQVFTSGSEWMVSGEPLTPASVQVRRQTRIGSRVDCSVPPRDIDGATLFVARDGRRIGEFLFTDLEQSYQVSDLTLLAGPEIEDIREMDYDAARRLLHVVLGDGRLASLTQFRAESVTAWTRQETEGRILSLALAGGETFLLVEREGGVGLEVFDPALFLDSALVGEAESPSAAWSGLDHLEGQEVEILGEGRFLGTARVEEGAVLLPEPVRQVVIGLGYRHTIEPLPPVVRNATGAGYDIAHRLLRVSFRLLETHELSVDLGEGAVPALPKPFEDTEAYSGDCTLRALGWSRRAGFDPLWRVEGRLPLPFTLLSVTTEMKVND